MTTPMGHDRCSESLGPFLRGELAPTEAGAVESHLATCAECSEERDALALMLAVEVEPLASDERARLAQAVAAQRRAEVVAFAPRRTRWRARVAPALGAAALIAVVAVSAVWFGSRDDDGEGAGDAFESITGTDAASPAPEQGALDRDDARARKKRASKDIALFSEENLDEEGASSTGSTTTQGQASKPAPASEPIPFTDEGDGKGGGGDESGGDTSGDEGETGPPDQSAKAAPDSLSISPTADTAEIGTCNPFTITVADEDGDPVKGVILDVEQRHELSQDDTPANEPDVGFCTPSEGPNPSAVDESAGDLASDGDAGTAGGETAGTTNGKGQVTIGIEVAPANGSDGTGDVTLVAFFDADGDNDPGSDEPQDSSTNTWVAPEQDRSTRPRAATCADRRGIF